MKNNTPRENVEFVLNRGDAKIVPFTMYKEKIPQCTTERYMRNNGLCIVERIPVFSTWRPNVKVTEHTYWKDSKRLTRIQYETPKGSVSTLIESAGFTSWTHEKMFKTSDDYKVLLFLIQDEVYRPEYATVLEAMNAAGDDFIFRGVFGLEPLQSIISGNLMGMETFCMEWMDNRDEILKLYNALVEKRRVVYPIVAKSPVMHANYGGNVTPEIIGLETFQKYYIQHYNEAAEIMHKHGKLIGCHFDANCKLLAKDIQDTALDYIEAFTPAPDTDMSLSEARKAWPDKVLWLNFPSSVHLKSPQEVTETTISMMNELDSTLGIIMGITEDIPQHIWQTSCKAIMDGLELSSRKK
jgi:hypothetical protein